MFQAMSLRLLLGALLLVLPSFSGADEQVLCGSNGALCAATSGFIVMVDCGSTGSRSFVFRYPERKLDASQFPMIIDPPLTIPTLLVSFATTPGISSFHEEPDGIERNLSPLLKSVADALHLHDPHVNLRQVPVYLGATAGMRELPRTERDKVMKAVRNFLHSDANPFSFARDEQARVLAGEEEGAFAWLSVNQMQASIDPSPDTTLGSLDFGGASMQIAFVPEDVSIMSSFFPMHFGGAVKGPIHLYTHSFPRFGFVDAFQRMTTLLQAGQAGQAADAKVLDHPCLPRGLSWQVTPGQYGVSTNARWEKRDEGPLELRGTGNFEQCFSWAEKLIDKETECFEPPCSMLGVYQPRLNRSRFVLMAHHADLLNWEVLALMEKGIPLLKALHLQLPKVCALDLSTQVELFGEKGLVRGGVPPCWSGTWILTMLKGLGFSEDADPSYLIDVPDCCDNTLGHAIYEVNFFPYRIGQTSSLRIQESRMNMLQIPRQINGKALAIAMAVSALCGAFAATVLLVLAPWRSLSKANVGFTDSRQPFLLA